MVHGLDANASSWTLSGLDGFFRPLGFAQKLNEFGWPILGCGTGNTDKAPCLERLDFAQDDRSYEINAKDLGLWLKDMTKQLGVRGVHLIGHSKGGIDSREYLANDYKKETSFRVLTLTTLDTPHDGSVLADVKFAQAQAIAAGVVDLPTWVKAASLLYRQGYGTAHLQLRPGAAAEWNKTNVSALPGDVQFQAHTADATDGFEFLFLPGHVEEFLPVSLILAANTMYTTLGRRTWVSFKDEERCSLLGFTCMTVPAIVESPAVSFLPNDLAVTENSAKGVGGGFSKKVAVTWYWTNTNHTTVKRADVAEVGVADQLRRFEKRNKKGGLR